MGKYKFIRCHHIVTDDEVLHTNLTLPESEHTLCRELNMGHDAHILTLQCSNGCGSMSNASWVEAYHTEDDEARFSHFFCNYCGETIEEYFRGV